MKGNFLNSLSQNIVKMRKLLSLPYSSEKEKVRNCGF
jgi:hypothetical protein